MQQRKGTAAQWISTNSGQGPVLNAGEIGFEMDTNKFKIGDGVNHWVDLNYFIDGEGALAEITALIDGAPAALNTLNELAAAINDDPSFFTTIATNLSNHQSDTTNIHGIADTSLLATKAYADNAVSTAVDNLVAGAPALLNTLDELAAAMGDDPAYLGTIASNLSALNTDFDGHLGTTTNVHGIADVSLLATKSYVDTAESDAIAAAATAADTKISSHNSDTTSVHGIANTADLATQSYVADGIAQEVLDRNSAISTHNDDTTNVHGIANTASLATQSYVDTEISTAIGDEVSDRDDAISAHNSDTTNVHGITDTAALAFLTDVSGAISTEVTDRNSAIENAIADEVLDRDSAISAHNDDTLNVHGIADTAALATRSYVDTELSDAIAAEVSARDIAISTHNDETINVHGIADTQDLATQDYVLDQIAASTVNQSALAGTGLAWDGDNDQFIIDGTVATKTYAAELLTGANKTNIVITGDQNGLVITAENGVADSTTSDLLEGTNLYFTNERAQDAVGLNVGLGLTYTDSTGEIKVNTSEIQARVANVSDEEIGHLNGVTSSVQTQIDSKAPLANPTFTGTVSGINSAMVGLGNVNNTSDANKPVSTAQQTALNLKADLASPALTGVPTAPTASAGTSTTQVATTAFVSGAVSDLVASAPGALNTLNELAVALGNDENFSTSVANSIATKAPIESPTFTGTVSGVTKSMVGLGNVDNTSDASKPVSTATQTALNLKVNTSDVAELAQDAVNTAIIAGTGLDKAYDDVANTITLDIDSTVATLTGTQTLTNKTITSPLGLVKADVGLANVDNTTDAAKPVSTATQTALDLKANLAGPTFTGTVSGITKSMVGLGNVDNTTDAAKPVSTATQTALDLKAPLASPALSGVPTAPTAAANTNTTQIATTAYVQTEIADLIASAPGALDTLDELAAALGDDANYAATITTALAAKAPLISPTFTGTVSGVTKSMVGLGNVDNTTDAGKPVSTATQTALDLKAPLASPTFTGTVTLPTGTVTSGMILDGTIVNSDINASAAIDKTKISGTAITAGDTGTVTSTMIADGTIVNGDINATAAIDWTKLAISSTVSATELGYVDGVTSAIQTQLNARLPLAGGTMTGALTLSAAPTSDLHAATKLYVDNVTAGINFHESVHAATTANLSADYANGTNGVGATLTATANGAWTTLDGHSSFTQNDRILVKDQTDTKQNGIYVLSDLGSPTTKWVLTRASDADNNPSGEMEKGDFVLVINGTTNASYGFINNSTANPIAIGTDAITYSAFNAGKTVTAGNGLQEATPGIISIDTSVTQTRVSGVTDTEIGYLDGVTSAIQTQIDSKAPLASPTFTGTVSGITKAMVGLGNVDNTTDAAKPVSTATQTALDLKAPLASPTFTGTVSGVTKAHVGLGNVDNTSDAAKPVSTAQATAIATAKSEAIADATAQVNAVIASAPAALNTLDELAAALGDDANYAATITSALALKAPLANPTFTGTVTLPTGTVTSGMIADGTIANADINASAAIALSKLASGTSGQIIVANASGVPTWVSETGDVTVSDTGVTAIASGVIVDADVNASAAIAQSKIANLTTDLAAKAPLASPTFTGTVAGITKAMVGLGNVDNTTDAGKPISTATQTALDLKAPLASPTFTGSVTLPTGTVTSAMISDGTIVDGDINAAAAISQSKISGLTSDLALKAPLASPALTGTPTAPTATAGTNTTQVATTAFVGTAVANLVASAPSALDTLNELATALGNDASFSTTVTNSIATKAPIASPTFTGTATIPTLTLTNPLSAANGGTGLSSLGTGVATFLGTPSSANLAAMITDEIGTGNIVLSEVSTNAQTASYTLVAADRGKLVEMNVASANTLTVPLNSTVPFPIGTQIDLLQVGAGKTTIAGAAGVTVNATPGLAIRAQWGGATLIKRAENTWVLIGDLTV